MTNQTPLLNIKNLSVAFHTEHGKVMAVDDLSFQIGAGQTMGLVGESGSGKSVTALSVLGLVPQPPGQITAGQIEFHGTDLLSLPDKQLRKIRGNDISMVFQEPMTSLNPVFRVGYQIAEVLRLHQKLSRQQAKARTIELMDWVGIPEPQRRYKSYPHEMSGGQKQRVMIAMAIACEPQLLICDEPTTALDVTIQRQVLELLKNLQKELDMSMLFITHDLGVIADLADEVVVMYQAKKVEQASTRQIFNAPQHPYTKGLLACRPKLHDNPQRLLTVADFMDATGQELTPDKSVLASQQKTDKSTQKTLLEVKNLKTYFPLKSGFFGRVTSQVKAVDDVSFTVRKGETLGLVGESGCGKTTLGRTILKLQAATAGEVFYDGIDVFKQSPQDLRRLRSKMQIIFQDPYASLNPRMTVGQTLMEPLQLHQSQNSKAQNLQRAAELMAMVGMNPDQLNRFPHEFSGGQRQRISIARALAVEPEFIICDESVSALDVSVQAQVLNLLLDLQDQMDLTYIFISHDLSVINFIADRVGVMNQGKLVELNTAEAIYRNPQNEYTKKLLAAIPDGLPKAK
ncbi:ABC transporter ATP-binding protein [Marinicella sp. S1101]|uniref:ABC transporter ATP-binding protein n=1 Tax=Marinicella marina TaxID=2996016 RepID=UPI002260CAF9|nr:ABC transporter ATP-binding protein [Marinicella marina]MCX7552585.1 ABC transporter ATP-binding protein [Marinicella marina]MDJ1139461.1 ABC transporter ATP-binding protein [Marinicella marina]